MTRPRNYLSGNQKRKRAVAKTVKEQAVLSKHSKLESYFSSYEIKEKELRGKTDDATTPATNDPSASETKVGKFDDVVCAEPVSISVVAFNHEKEELKQPERFTQPSELNSDKEEESMGKCDETKDELIIPILPIEVESKLSEDGKLNDLAGAEPVSISAVITESSKLSNEMGDELIEPTKVESQSSKSRKLDDLAGAEPVNIFVTDCNYDETDNKLIEPTEVESESDTYFSKINWSDPSEWPLMTDKLRDHIIRNPLLQDPRSINFSKSFRVYQSETRSRVRKMTQEMFFVKQKNNELQRREWLYYSEATGKCFCIPCSLFATQSENVCFQKAGFNDWSHPHRFQEHERSLLHRKNVGSYVARGTQLGKIDAELQQKFVKQVEYWKEVLRRVVSAIKFLGKRGLAFRGTEEKLGSFKNGNFLGLIELIAEYDDFLNQHLKMHGNGGKGRSSYLSKTVVNELVHLMSSQMQKEISNEIKISKFFSISVDSTPDITHCD